MKLSRLFSKEVLGGLLLLVVIYTIAIRLIAVIDPSINQSELYRLLVAGLVVVGYICLYNFWIKKER